MLKHRIPALAAVALLSLPTLGWAESHVPDPATVVARVNGEEITLGHMIAMRASLPAQYQQLPPAALFKGILDQLIDQSLLAQTGENVATPRMELMLENQRRGMLASREISRMIEAKLTNDAIEAMYQERYAAISGTEWNASHILVETEEEAKALVDALNGGADFATLAQEKSTGPSGPNGGQLGWFGPGMMVAPFEQAVAGMEPESISDPVETQFGWHVIRLNEIRAKSAPPLNEVQGEIVEALRTQIMTEALEEARAGATITRDGEGLDPALLTNPDVLGE